MTWSRVGKWVPLPQMRDEATRYAFFFADERKLSSGDWMLERLQQRIRELGESIEAIRDEVFRASGDRWPE
jgi:hypothetical protein